MNFSLERHQAKSSELVAVVQFIASIDFFSKCPVDNGHLRSVVSIFVGCPILGSEVIDNLNIKSKMFDFDQRALIGWLANTVREPANQDTYLIVRHFCFYG